MPSQYENFANFKSSLKTFTVKEGSTPALEAATTAAVEHNMTICHVVPSQEEESGEWVFLPRRMSGEKYYI